MSKNTGLTYQLTHVNSSLLFYAAKFRLKENRTWTFSYQTKITRVDQINLKNTIFTAR